MYFKPKYLPPQKNPKKHKRKQILLVVFLLLIVLAIAIYFVFFKPKGKGPVLYDTYTICNLSGKQTQELFDSKEQLSTEVFSEAFFYGESLTITKDNYVSTEKNTYVGDTLQLTNLCNNEIHSFLMTSNLDTNIELSKLPVGFYTIDIQENLKGKSLVSKEKLSLELMTVSRNNKRHKIEVIANKDLFTNIYTGEPSLKQHQLFLQVSESEVNPLIVDVFLDPAYNHQDFKTINKGYVSDTFVASDETYKFAADVKTQLEKYGIVVAMTRTDDLEVVNTYGIDGRVERALKSKAKYMIEFNFGTEYNKTLQGVRAFGSAFATTNFQQLLLQPFVELQLPVYTGTRNQMGVYKNSKTNGLDTINIIRESGGKALFAGEFSERSKEENTYAINNPNGVHTVSLDLLLSSNENFEELYRMNYEQLVEATVLGILNQLEIEVNQ